LGFAEGEDGRRRSARSSCGCRSGGLIERQVADMNSRRSSLIGEASSGGNFAGSRILGAHASCQIDLLLKFEDSSSMRPAALFHEATESTRRYAAARHLFVLDYICHTAGRSNSASSGRSIQVDYMSV
jgi:hypothetical protein